MGQEDNLRRANLRGKIHNCYANLDTVGASQGMEKDQAREEYLQAIHLTKKPKDCAHVDPKMGASHKPRPRTGRARVADATEWWYDFGKAVRPWVIPGSVEVHEAVFRKEN